MSTKEWWAKRLAQREGHRAVGTWPMDALDRCDRCGARAYVRVLSRRRQELLFCGHHYRQHAAALAAFAIDIQDDTRQLGRSEIARLA